MPYTELTRIHLTQVQQDALLSLARRSIEHGSRHQQPLTVNLNLYESPLQQVGCCFVSLHKLGQLRGCIGALSPYQPLAKDVAEHAYAAAFRDHRFNPVSAEEIPLLTIEISVLTPQAEIKCDSETALLQQLQEGVDGVTLEDKHYRSTFLPAVWEKLPDKAEFLQQLKQKAGMPTDYWSNSMKVFRYRTLSFADAK
ncbi:AmmeMemoRadiSam system protein A [Exilibacterium tricleocarpae]|uniref:AmmeMemoRadiSam system protein A n=1 Tax=Exilibacterium tricleocarpae TaxID=2591008 RepID=A0A545TSF0_9GAMM|nr:AmmeMemoRadiSam system protein A [Exilibacterium tricleocarpae]TQV80147.1 AmmeMemoRadiSam system protein A [Exilibacterium tricleocarpae]